MNNDLLYATVVSILEHMESLLWDRKEDFIDFLDPDNFIKIEDIIDISFSSENVRVVYYIESGQHVADSRKLVDVFNWIKDHE